MEKTTTELMEEKEVMIKEYDQLILENSQRSCAKSRAEKVLWVQEQQKREDNGWNSSYINPTQPESEPEPIPEPKVDKRVLALEKARAAKAKKAAEEKAELEKQLKIAQEAVEALKAAKELSKEEDVDVIEEVLTEEEGE